MSALVGYRAGGRNECARAPRAGWAAWAAAGFGQSLVLTSLSSRLRTNWVDMDQPAGDAIAPPAPAPLDQLSRPAGAKQERQARLLWFVFVLLGLGILLPWNAVVNASAYFRMRLHYDNIAFVFSVAYMLPNLVGLFIVLWVEKYISSRLRAMGGLAVYVLLMIALPLQRSLAVTVFLVCVLGFLDAFVQSAIFAVASQFGAAPIEAMMVGLGVAGVLVTVLYIFALYVSTSAGAAETLAAELFFTSAGIVLLCCLAAAVVAYRLLAQRQPAGAAADVVEEVREDSSAVALAAPTTAASTPVIAPAIGRVEHIVAICKQIKLEMCVVIGNFVITLALFPGLTFRIPSTVPALNACPTSGPCPQGVGSSPVSFGIWLVFVFSLFDLVGRFVPRSARLQMSRVGLAWFTASRLVFLVLFMVQIRPRVIRSDGFAILVEALFALSNGYVGTLVMIYGPMRVTGARDRELAGIIMVVALTVGLTLGVSLGYAVAAVFL